MRQSQTGAALIAVLLFLILISVAGVIAVRQGRVDLKVATSDQADTLMLNSSDSVLAHIEQAASNTGTASYQRIMSQKDGVLGYFRVNSLSKEGEQVAFCYQPAATQLFDLSKARILKYGGGFENNPSDGAICNPANTSDYVSARSTSLTQVVVRGISSETAFNDLFHGQVQGEEATPQPNPRVQVHSVSVIPALSSASDATIMTCLKRPVGDGASEYGSVGADGNMTACLKSEGIPSTAIVEEGVLAKKVEGGYDDGALTSNSAVCGNDANCSKALGGGDPEQPTTPAQP